MSESYRPRRDLETLSPGFYDVVEPALFPEHTLRWRNQRLAGALGLGALTPAAWTDHFGRFRPLPGTLEAPLALRYHGHQFRSYNPELGDGRGFVFAELVDPTDGRHLTLGTKGSGRTPWSRGADGRLTLKGGVRELLATEMLEALGVRTSRTLSVIETGESLRRHDEPSPTRSCVLVRAGHSHFRFGTFQRLAYHRQTDLIAELVTYLVRLHQPDIEVQDDLARTTEAWFERVMERSAGLAAQWMVAGFVHGVLNTDNMNVNGESFDYGPYRFLPTYAPDFVAAYFDQTGLYRYRYQPSTIAWNLERLAETLGGVCDRGRLEETLEGFEGAFWAALTAGYLRRLGLKPRGVAKDATFVGEVLDFLHASQVPYQSFFFDWFGGDMGRALSRPRASHYDHQAFVPVRQKLRAYEPHDPDALAHPYFERQNPCDLLIDEIEALWDRVDKEGDWEALSDKVGEIRQMGDALG